jgi:hypothetical protein
MAKQEGTFKLVTYLQVIIIDLQMITLEEMIKKYSAEGDCPVRNVLDRIGDKWSILVICYLGDSGTLAKDADGYPKIAGSRWFVIPQNLPGDSPKSGIYPYPGWRKPVTRFGKANHLGLRKYAGYIEIKGGVCRAVVHQR